MRDSIIRKATTFKHENNFSILDKYYDYLMILFGEIHFRI